MLKNHLILLLFMAFLTSVLPANVVAQSSSQEAIQVTLTQNHPEFSFLVKGKNLWIDMNRNGLQEKEEAIESEKKQIRPLNDDLSPLTIYGEEINELIINDPERPAQIRGIDLSKAKSLVKMDLNANPLHGILNLKSCKNLEEARLKETQLEGIDATACYSLTHLYLSNSPKLKELILADCNRLTWLEAPHCIIENPILKGDISLSYIYLDDNNLTELNLPIACRDLKGVSVSNNPTLKELSIRAMTNLEELYASRCNLKKVDLSRGPSLIAVDLSCNELTELPLHLNPLKLKELRIYQNQFSLASMKKLVSALPADGKSKEEKKLFAINTLGVTPREANICSKSVVALAKHLGWDVYDYYGGNEYFYTGSIDPIIDPDKEGVVLTIDKKKGEEIDLDVKGENLFIDLNGNNKLDPGEALEVGQNTIKLLDRNIVTLYGQKLIRIRAPFDKIKEVDLSQAPNLEVVDFCSNTLEYIDLSRQKKLVELDLSSNKISSLVLPPTAPFFSINLAFNQFSTLALPRYNTLKRLWVNNNQLTSFSPFNFRSLEELHIEVNKIDFFAMRELVNELTDIDADKAKRKLYAVKTMDRKEKNHISQSMVEQARKRGWVVYNGLTPNYSGEEDPKLGDHSELITFNIGLKDQDEFIFFPKGEECWIDLNGNDSCDPGEELDATKGDKQVVNLGKNKNIHFYGKKITEFRVNEQMHIEKLDASKANSLELLWIRENNLAEISLPKEKKMKNLDLSSNKLSGDLDLTSYPLLEEVYLVTNQLESVDVSGLKNLKVLSLTENNLQKVDVASCENLKELYVASNNLESLDCSSLAKLETLAVFKNKIKKTAMAKLIEGLNDIKPSSPYRGKIFNVLLVTSEGKKSTQETNEMSDELITLAKGKYWTVNGWKEGGGVAVLQSTDKITKNNHSSVKIATFANGWIITRAEYSPEISSVAVYSLSGALILQNIFDDKLEIRTPIKRAILCYGNETYVLIR